MRDHRHVDQDTISLADAEIHEHARKRRHFILKLGVGEALFCAGERAVIDKRRPRTIARLDMAIDGVEAGIAEGADEPAVETVDLGIDLVPRLDPIDLARGLGPVLFGIGLPALIGLRVVAHRVSPDLSM